MDCMKMIKESTAKHTLINVLLYIQYVYDKLSSSSSGDHHFHRNNVDAQPIVTHTRTIRGEKKNQTINETAIIMTTIASVWCDTLCDYRFLIASK